MCNKKETSIWYYSNLLIYMYSLQAELSLEYDKSLGGNTSNLNVSTLSKEEIWYLILSGKEIQTEDKQILYLNFLI